MIDSSKIKVIFYLSTHIQFLLGQSPEIFLLSMRPLSIKNEQTLLQLPTLGKSRIQDNLIHTHNPNKWKTVKISIEKLKPLRYD